jgi:hypothetical protein
MDLAFDFHGWGPFAILDVELFVEQVELADIFHADDWL